MQLRKQFNDVTLKFLPEQKLLKAPKELFSIKNLKTNYNYVLKSYLI